MSSSSSSSSSLPRFSLVPGPTRLEPETLAVLAEAHDASPDLEPEFFALYERCAARLCETLHCSSVAIMSGEAMVALWGAVRSVVGPGDKVLCVANGLFGEGFADMARAAGADVVSLTHAWDGPLDLERVRKAMAAERPTLVTAVHCETPSGTLNRCLAELGALCQQHEALFLVDFVASAYGTPLDVEAAHIDLGLLGSQKVLSLPPDLGIVSLSPAAWRRVEQVGYQGYDALLPFRTATKQRHFPYTHNWRALAALDAALARMDVSALFARHEAAATLARRRVRELGLQLFAESADASLLSPTVTAVKVPEGWEWAELDKQLRARGVVFGGSYGPLKNRVFRIGHMGSQAREELVEGALAELAAVLGKQ